MTMAQMAGLLIMRRQGVAAGRPLLPEELLSRLSFMDRGITVSLGGAGGEGGGKAC